MIGLVDCNNFYASCERVFRPDLQHAPIIILSNNDGCVIARSNEAKALGIKMGVPFYQVKHLVENGRVHVFSSNYTLYGDMSKRIMSIVRKSVPRIEVYSIDECFIDLEGDKNAHETGLHLAQKIKQWTGVPVSIGIAQTKTLAKMASKYAKRYAAYRGCCIIDTPEKKNKALQSFPIKDVWGIGRRHYQALKFKGVETALDFTKWSKQQVQREFGITGVMTWKELQGISCIGFEPTIAKKTITTSRSFRKEIEDFETLSGIVADFAALCSKKLREQDSKAAELYVFIQTNRFRNDIPQYNKSAVAVFDVPTSDPLELVKAATETLRKIFIAGNQYKQAGVTVNKIYTGVQPLSLFDPIDREKREKLLHSIDSIHRKMGERSLLIARQKDCSGESNRQYRSKLYTTNLDDIIQVSIN